MLRIGNTYCRWEDIRWVECPENEEQHPLLTTKPTWQIGLVSGRILLTTNKEFAGKLLAELTDFPTKVFRD